MADRTQYADEELVHELEFLRQQYSDMEAAYKVQMNQTLANSDITKAKKELRKKRAACVELSNERDALLDRIADLERGSRPDASIATRRRTEGDVRLKERLLPALNEPLKLEVNPYLTSRHCGPDVIQKHHYLAAQQIAQYEQQQLPKTEFGIHRDFQVKPLPKRAPRPSKTTLLTSGSGNVAGSSAPTSNPPVHTIEPSNLISAIETDAQLSSTANINGNHATQRTGARTRARGENNDTRAEATTDGEGVVNEDLLPNGSNYAAGQGGISRESIMEG